MTIDFHLYLINSISGQPLAAEWGRIRLPENRTVTTSRIIDLPLVRLPGRGRKSDTPIFYLVGGPGISILDHLNWVAGQLPDRDALGDLIIMEPRGVGHARPSLDCPGTYDLPLDRPTDYETALQAHQEYISQAVDFWRGQQVDLAGYNAREMAADVDEVRRALGYPQIALMGGSFGSHHGMAIMRYFGDSVERAVKWGIEGPDHTLKLPRHVQSRLEDLNHHLQKDHRRHPHLPDLLELMGRVLDELDRQPISMRVQDPHNGALNEVAAGKYDLQWVTADGLKSTTFLRALPTRYLAMAGGDYTWLAGESLRLRTGLQSNLAYELVDCSSGATAGRRALVQAQAPGTLLENAINETLFGVCDLLGVLDLGDEFRGDLVSDIPTLLIAGSLDPRTPLENAQEVLAGLSHGQLLMVEGASHDQGWRGPHATALREIRDAFLAGEMVETQTLSAEFQFDPLAEGYLGEGLGEDHHPGNC